jgi:diguanylate cyclase (GGDEF)-like protein
MRMTAPRFRASMEALLAAGTGSLLLPLYTAATITVGALALVLVTLQVPVSAKIAIAGLGSGVGLPAGVALWTLFGLAGAARIVREPSGHGVFTFHMPFVVAAMALGGPVAGGWVAMISSFDRHELEETPWYGILANHAALTLGAIVGGLLILVLGATGDALGLAGSSGFKLVAVLAGTFIYMAVTVALAAGTIVLRDGITVRETLALFDESFRTSTIAETLLGWLLTVAYIAVGWWGPIVCTVMVLALWRASGASEQTRRDELTGVLNMTAFTARAVEAVNRARRGVEGAAYVFIDLDQFKAVNDAARDHHVGDQVLTEVGLRLRGAIRANDAAGRRSGDEFVVLLAGVSDEVTAERLAKRLHTTIVAPYSTDIGELRVGASVGVALIEPQATETELEVRRRADAAMYEIKERGGGVRIYGESTGA